MMIEKINIIPSCMSIHIIWVNGDSWFIDDFNEIIEIFPQYCSLKNDKELFSSGKLNDNGTAIIWGDISIDAFTIYCWCVNQYQKIEENKLEAKKYDDIIFEWANTP